MPKLPVVKSFKSPNDPLAVEALANGAGARKGLFQSSLLKKDPDTMSKEELNKVIEMFAGGLSGERREKIGQSLMEAVLRHMGEIDVGQSGAQPADFF